MNGTTTPRFKPACFDFLRELKANNERSWFEANKARYHADVRDPMLDFIAAFAEPLAAISPHFVADPRANGGSLFRIYRDVRFSPDKRPYKTNAGAHFRHAAGKDAHAPGFYLHLEPDACFAACGIWHPGSEALAHIRNAIVEDPDGWTRITQAKVFRDTFTLRGQSLKRPPRDYDAAHPLIADLKRKDFIAGATFCEADAIQPDFLQRFTHIAQRGAAFVAFLSRAVGVPF